MFYICPKCDGQGNVERKMKITGIGERNDDAFYCYCLCRGGGEQSENENELLSVALLFSDCLTMNDEDEVASYNGEVKKRRCAKCAFHFSTVQIVFLCQFHHFLLLLHHTPPPIRYKFHHEKQLFYQYFMYTNTTADRLHSVNAKKMF